MDKVTLTPVLSDAYYEGRFTTFHFGLLASPIPVYESLIKHLGDEGANLDSLKLETASLSTANISCSLLKLNTIARVRIDRFDVTFLRTHQIEMDQAASIVHKTWTALQEVDSTLKLSEHTVAISIYAQLNDISYEKLMERYTKPVGALGSKGRVGVVFYTPEIEGTGQKAGSIVLDRIATHEQGITLKVTAGFSAAQVPFQVLPKRVEDYVTSNLDLLGIVLGEKK